MPEALHIHRRVILDEDSLILQHIHYALTEEGRVDILKMTSHFLLENETLGANFFNGELSTYLKLSLLNILVEDEVIDIP